MGSRPPLPPSPSFEVLIGLTGTNGAGKGEVAHYLVARYGFVHVRVRDVLVALLEAQGRPTDRDHLREYANTVRARRGPAVLVTALLQRMAREGNRRVVVDSVRVPAEAEAIRDAGGILVAIDADRRIRYERVRRRGSRTDAVSFETFVRQEEAELTGAGGPASQHLAAVMESADVVITNNGTVETLHRHIDELMRQLGVAAVA